MLPGKKFSFNSQGGQVFLIVVLIMFIGLTVGLSVASRSVTNLKSSIEEENSQRAFAAAEAGVEKALKNLAVPTGPFGEGDTKIKGITQTSIAGTTEFSLRDDTLIDANDGVDIWLTNDPSKPLNGSTKWSGNFKLVWGDVNTCSDADTTAGLEVIVFYESSSGIVASQRYLYDPCTTRGTGTVRDKDVGTYTIGSREYKFRTKDPIIITNGYIARIIPLYAGSRIGITAISAALPLQGKKISSTGTAGGTTRTVNYFQGYPKIPNELFQYVLFQPN